jgi:hypothetical protein
MGRFMRHLRSHAITAIVVALAVGGATAVAAPTAVTSVVKLAKKAKKADRATRANYAKTAGKAKRATLALSAKVADNSARLGGHTASEYARGPANVKIDFRVKAGTGETDLLNTGKFELSASCDGAGHLRVLAATKVDHAAIEGFGNGGDVQDDDFQIADSPVNLGPTQGEHRNVSYTEPGGQTVDLSYIASDVNVGHGAPLGGSVDCLVSGFAIVG